jgi:hypothetical protein
MQLVPLQHGAAGADCEDVASARGGAVGGGGGGQSVRLRGGGECVCRGRYARGGRGPRWGLYSC